MVIHLCNAFFLSFRMLCVCQVFQYLEAQPPVSYIEHTFPPLAFSKLSRGDLKKCQISGLVKVNDLWVSDKLVQQYFSIRAKTNPRQYDALLGVTTADWFHSQGSRALREGITEEERDRFSLSSLPCLWDHHCHYHCQHLLPFTYRIIRLLRSYVMNNYDAHFREIFLAVLNEYTNWDQVRVTIILSHPL